MIKKCTKKRTNSLDIFFQEHFDINASYTILHHPSCHATFPSSILQVLVAIVIDSSATTSTVPLHLAGDV
jgi:hypothetical protein